MSDLKLANGNIFDDFEIIDAHQQLIDAQELNDIKEKQLLDDEAEIKQKELTTQELFEELKTDLEAKQPSKARKIIERIIGGVLLGAAAVAAVAVSLASFGVATAVTGAVVGTLGGTLGTSIISVAAGLIGIGTLVHSGLSTSSVEAYAAGKLESLLKSSLEMTDKMPQEMREISKNFVIDVIKQINNEVLNNIDDVDECKRLISTTKEFINNKLEVLSRFQDTKDTDMSPFNYYVAHSTQYNIDKMIRKHKEDNSKDFDEQFIIDVDRQNMIIQRKKFALTDAKGKCSSLKKLFPNPKVSYFLSCVLNQTTVVPLASLVTTTKKETAEEFRIDPKDMPNCIGSTINLNADNKARVHGLFIMDRVYGLGNENGDLIYNVEKIDDNKNKTSKAIVTISKNYGIADAGGVFDRNYRKFGFNKYFCGNA